MPNCYTPLEELVYYFGGPWPFALLLSGVLVLLGLLLSTLRIKLVESSSYVARIEHHQSSHHFPYLLSLSEVCYKSLHFVRCSKCFYNKVKEYLSGTLIYILCFLWPRLGAAELKNLRAMFTGCTSWAPILLENHGTFLTLLLTQ